MVERDAHQLGLAEIIHAQHARVEVGVTKRATAVEAPIGAAIPETPDVEHRVHHRRHVAAGDAARVEPGDVEAQRVEHAGESRVAGATRHDVLELARVHALRAAHIVPAAHARRSPVVGIRELVERELGRREGVIRAAHIECRVRAGIQLIHLAGIRAGLEVAGGARHASITGRLRVPEECLSERNGGGPVLHELGELSWFGHRHGLERRW